MHEELESTEAMREIILSQRRELDLLRRENADVALLVDALDALLQVDGDEDPFASVFRILQPVFRYSDALVLMEGPEPGTPLLCIVATSPELVEREWQPNRLLEKVLAGRVTSTVRSDDIAAVTGAQDVLDPRQPALCFPLGMRRRRGMMVVLRDQEEEGFDRRDIALAHKFSLLASHALAARSANRSESERKRLHRLTQELEDAQAALAHRANHDVLTGLPNRAYFEERVTSALRRADQRPLALAFIDLDGFKQVNDRYGHEVGDRLLANVADRIVANIRSTDVVARISGDEFVALIDPLDTDAVLEAIVERLLGTLKEPFLIDGTRIRVSASIGVALAPEHGMDYDHLRRNADLAMYSAKSQAKGTAARFDLSLGRAVTERAELERAVRRAVEEQRFRPVLQPLVNLRTMEINGFEVLARLVDDEGRLRPPAEFINLATELGLLDAITTMLVDEVIETIPSLDERFGSRPSISVNVSARQAVDVAGMRRLLDRLEDSGYTDRFVVEVTEDAYLHAGVFQRDVLPLLRQRGVRVSIDDFGTGYSSLSSLLHLDAHELKIDRAFVTDVHRRARSQVILHGMASAARQLDINVVAEGVETVEEFAFVRSIPAIQIAQGYLFAKPAPIADLIDSADEILDRLRSLSSAPVALPAGA